MVIKKYIIAGIVVGLLVVAGGFINYKNSKVSVELKAPADASISLFVSQPSDGGVSFDKNKPVLNTSSSVRGEVKKGTYVYVVEPKNSDYKRMETTIGIDKQTTIEPSLELTEEKSADAAQEKIGAINSLLTDKYPVSTSRYRIDKVEAYKNGTWFGVRLIPINPEFDAIVAVVKTNNDDLVLATEVPAPILSTAVYPDIPEDVIVATNNLILQLPLE